jgi:ribosomal-protein-alanine N-acetyltransferase
MLDYIFDWSQNKKIKNLTLEVRETNVPAIKLYEKNGFKEAGIRKDYYEKPKENAVIMWKQNL